MGPGVMMQGTPSSYGINKDSFHWNYFRVAENNINNAHWLNDKMTSIFECCCVFMNISHNKLYEKLASKGNYCFLKIQKIKVVK